VQRSCILLDQEQTESSLFFIFSKSLSSYFLYNENFGEHFARQILNALILDQTFLLTLATDGSGFTNS
jgi:hypothetical protein